MNAVKQFMENTDDLTAHVCCSLPPSIPLVCGISLSSFQDWEGPRIQVSKQANIQARTSSLLDPEDLASQSPWQEAGNLSVASDRGFQAIDSGPIFTGKQKSRTSMQTGCSSSLTLTSIRQGPLVCPPSHLRHGTSTRSLAVSSDEYGPSCPRHAQRILSHPIVSHGNSLKPAVVDS